MTTQTLQIDEQALDRMQGAVEQLRWEYEHLAHRAYHAREFRTALVEKFRLVRDAQSKLVELQSCERAVAAYLDACGVQQ